MTRDELADPATQHSRDRKLLWSALLDFQLNRAMLKKLPRSAHLCILVIISPPGDLDAQPCGYLPDSLQPGSFQ